ncbi:MAG: hypothetical protein HWN67_12055 [Candidatus Helarchaeota archaeon]|nr:hypothetical protein [Candidatus Helarchaeota archaeon]
MFEKIQNTLIDFITTGHDFVIKTAALALGALNAGGIMEKKISEDSMVLKKLIELTEPKYEEKDELLSVFATIGLGFIFSSKFKEIIDVKKYGLEYDSAKRTNQEAIAIIAGLGSLSNSEQIINKAMSQKGDEYNWGATVGACLYMLETGKVPYKEITKDLDELINHDYYDVASNALICYGFTPLDESQAQRSIEKVEPIIDFEQPYEKRIASILSSTLMSANLTDEVQAMKNSHKYSDAGLWAVLAMYACYPLYVIPKKENLTDEEFSNYPFVANLPPESIYEEIGLDLGVSMLSSIAAEDLKDFIFRNHSEIVEPHDEGPADTNFAYLANKGLITPFKENPKEEFIKLLKEEYSPILEALHQPKEKVDKESAPVIDTSWNLSRLKIGATLGIGWGIYTLRKLSKSDDEILELAFQLLEKAIQSNEILVQTTAIISMLAIAAKSDMFRKFLLVHSLFEFEYSDYTYFKVVYLIHTIYLILCNKFNRL